MTVFGWSGMQAQDVPVVTQTTLFGNYDQVLNGTSFYPATTSGSFTIDLPTCTDGSTPNIVYAFLNWQGRWRSNSNDATVPTFDQNIDFQIGANPVQSIAASAHYVANNPSSSNRNLYLFTSIAEVTAQV